MELLRMFAKETNLPTFAGGRAAAGAAGRVAPGGARNLLSGSYKRDPSGTENGMSEATVETRLALLEQIAEYLGGIIKDHETRLRWIERVTLYAMGALGIGDLVLHALDRLKH
jgi:hypothetical protein